MQNSIIIPIIKFCLSPKGNRFKIIVRPSPRKITKCRGDIVCRP